MAAYRRVYDSHHLQADCQEPESAPGNRVWAAFLVSSTWAESGRWVRGRRQTVIFEEEDVRGNSCPGRAYFQSRVGCRIGEIRRRRRGSVSAFVRRLGGRHDE